MGKYGTLTDYDSSARDYELLRRPSSATVQALRMVFSAVPDEAVVLSLGCGTGHYEEALFDGRGVVGLDRSSAMLRMARTRVEHCVEGDIVRLPFADSIFEGVYFVQSLHHVGANLSIKPSERDELRKTALAEAVRVLRKGPVAIVQRDPSQIQAVWFWEYFPAALATKLAIQPRIDAVLAWLKELGIGHLRAIPVDDPMIEGFYDAESPLDASFRRAFSEFSYLTCKQLSEGEERLRAAIRSGRVVRDIETCRRKFAETGGTVFVVSGIKPAARCASSSA